MQSEGLGTGSARKVRAERERRVDRLEESRLEGDAGGGARDHARRDGQATKADAHDKFGVDAGLSRAPEAERDRLVRGSLKKP